jgi:hypothetical protein
MFAFTCQTVFAQTPDSSEKPKPMSELKFNVAYALFEIVEIDYELILNNDFSVGLAANYWFAYDPYIQWQVIPNFRYYPIESMYGSGFFIEVNACFLTLNDYYYSDFSQTERKTSSFGGGMGLAPGYKFLSKGGFVLEIYTGLGRIFGVENFEVYPRVGVTMGKRF